MFAVTDEFKAAMRESGRIVEAQLTVGDTVFTTDDIVSLTVTGNAAFPGTAMRSINVSLKNAEVLTTTVGNNRVFDSVKVGVQLPDGTVEYVDYGKFYIATDDNSTKYNEDTQAYTFTAYDGLIKAMVAMTAQVPDEGETETPITAQALFDAVVEQFGWTAQDFPSLTAYPVLESAYSGATYRDFLDDIAEVLCGIIRLDGSTLLFSRLNKTDENISLEEMSALSTGERAAINTIVLQGENQNYSITNETLPLASGMKTVELTIENNPILQYSIAKNANKQALTENYTVGILSAGLYAYNAVNLETFGVLWLDFGDVCTAEGKDGSNKTVWVLNYTVTVDGGLKESIQLDAPTSQQPEYSYTEPSAAGIKSEINKLASGLQLKVSKGDVVSEINQSPDTISLSASRIEILSDDFTLQNGQMSAKAGEIAGFTINDTALTKIFTIGNIDYTVAISSQSGSSTLRPLISVTDSSSNSYSFYVNKDGSAGVYRLYVSPGGSVYDGSGYNVLNPQNVSSGNTTLGYGRLQDGKQTVVYGGRVAFTAGGDTGDTGGILMRLVDATASGFPTLGTMLLYFVEKSGSKRTILRPQKDNGAFLGTASYKWDTVYAGNGVNTGSDRKLKKDIADFNTDQARAFINALQPVTYKLKDGTGRTHMGLIAQDVAEAAKNTVGDIAACKAAVVDGDEEKYFDTKATDNELMWSLNYSELIAPLLAVVQDQEKRIQTLEQQLDDLRGEVDALKAKL